MFTRFMDWLDSQPPGRRRLYSLFLAIVLLTLPCYAAGVFLLAFGTPPPPGNPAPVMTDVPTASPTVTTPTTEPIYVLPATPYVPPQPTREEGAETEPVATPLPTPPGGTVLAETATPLPAPPTLTEVPTPPAASETATAAPTVEATLAPTTEPATPEPTGAEPAPTDTPGSRAGG